MGNCFNNCQFSNSIVFTALLLLILFRNKPVNSSYFAFDDFFKASYVRESIFTWTRND